MPRYFCCSCSACVIVHASFFKVIIELYRIMLGSYIFQARRFDDIMGRIKGVEDQLKLLFSSGIATALSTPPQNSAVTFARQLAPTSWPAVTIHQPAVATNQPAVATHQSAVSTNQPAVATHQSAVATNQPAVATNHVMIPNELATYNVVSILCMQ